MHMLKFLLPQPFTKPQNNAFVSLPDINILASAFQHDEE